MSVAASWFLSLTSPVLVDRAGRSATGSSLLPTGTLRVAPVVSRRVIRRLATRPRPKLFPDEPGPSRQDFVGQTITFRGKRMDTDLGQA
ncbi:hypothetical protein [Streptomyces sp. NBC_01353]|uniref:hypothetical protein n=1 Tax=Streptomyces sp. NBC_01353 TaxID=2903835 RepID=UPI002E380A54|nr:hypothetical protein [Streptomyces sp. NBC_01353]